MPAPLGRRTSTVNEEEEENTVPSEEEEELEECARCGCVECECGECECCGRMLSPSDTNCRCGAFLCGECGVWRNQDAYAQDGECTECHPNYSEYIHDYGYHPPAEYFTSTHKEDKSNRLFFGMELEVNGHAEKAELVADRVGDRAYLKYDGSLSSGFEIVTHPHTFKAMREFWERYFACPVRGLRSYKSGECGCHVHISRRALEKGQIRRMLVFLNAPENHDFIRFVAQRGDNHYSKIFKKPTNQVMGLECNDRYEALNLSNSRTVEVRIFRGSYRLDRILKNLEFCHALVEWTKEVGYRDLTVTNFLAWVLEREGTYRNLVNYIRELNPIMVKEGFVGTGAEDSNKEGV